MSTEAIQMRDGGSPRKSDLGRGRLVAASWQCECRIPANRLTTKASGPNKGIVFWRCSKPEDQQCAFFLWEEHETAAKEWLKNSYRLVVPQTPTKRKASSAELDPSTPGSGNPPQELVTPFTLAKRKPLSESPTKQTDRGNHINQAHREEALNDPFTAPYRSPEQPSNPIGKVAPISMAPTLRQAFTDRLKRAAVPLPIPAQDQRFVPGSTVVDAEPQLLPLEPSSPTLGKRLNHHESPNDSNESDPTETVLDLIRSSGHELKFLTEIQLRHKIGLALDAEKGKLQRCEETISQLRKRVDELETIVLNLVGDECDIYSTACLARDIGT